MMGELDNFLHLFNEGVIDEEEMGEALDRYLEMYAQRRTPQSRSLRYGVFNLDEMGDEDVILNFRFHREHLPVLMNLLEIPFEMVLPGRHRISGVKALCIMLRRLTYPNRLTDLEPLFGISGPYLSVVTNHMVKLVLQNKGHHLEDLRNMRWLNQDRLHYYAQAVHSQGAALSNCWGLIDGTARKICRPSLNQETYYSGHKRFHSLKYQPIMAPDGIIVSLKGSYDGRAHDAAIWSASHIQEQLREVCVFPDVRYVLYGDPTYPLSDLLISPYSATRRDEPVAAAFNRSMSVVRRAVEWGFGKVIQQFAFVDFSKNQKLLTQNVEGMYKTSVLLTNCHTCLYGSQVNEFFQTNPPTLEEYLR